jgi:hypothetical protein
MPDFNHIRITTVSSSHFLKGFGPFWLISLKRSCERENILYCVENNVYCNCLWGWLKWMDFNILCLLIFTELCQISQIIFGNISSCVMKNLENIAFCVLCVFFWQWYHSNIEKGDRHDRDRMVVGFTTTYVSKYVPITTNVVSLNPIHVRCTRYNIMFVSD